MSIFTKILGKETNNIIKSSTELIDEIVTTEEERSTLKESLTKILSNSYTRIIEAQASVIQAEASGNFLQRSWRPIVMLSFAFIVMYNKFAAPAFGLPNAELEGQFWELLKIGVGGYVIGRSVEKLGTTVTKNMDLGMLKRKDRKNFME